MSDDIKKKLGIQDTHQQMYDELFAEMVARAVDNDPDGGKYICCIRT